MATSRLACAVQSTADTAERDPGFFLDIVVEGFQHTTPLSRLGLDSEKIV
jgi:hypothetical protein